MIALEALLKSIAASVQTSQDAIQFHAYQNFMKYFSASSGEDNAEENAAGSAEGVIEADDSKHPQLHIPIIRNFHIPDACGNDSVSIPAVALVNHDSLILENVRIVLNVSGKSDGEHFMVSTEPMNEEQGLEHHQITLDFRKKEPPEGISRILTGYSQLL